MGYTNSLYTHTHTHATQIHHTQLTPNTNMHTRPSKHPLDSQISLSTAPLPSRHRPENSPHSRLAAASPHPVCWSGAAHTLHVRPGSRAFRRRTISFWRTFRSGVSYLGAGILNGPVAAGQTFGAVVSLWAHLNISREPARASEPASVCA